MSFGVEGLFVDYEPLGVPPGAFDGGGFLVLVVVEVNFDVLAVDGDHFLSVGERDFLLNVGVVGVDSVVFGLVAVEVDLASCFCVGADRPDELYVFDVAACLFSGLCYYCIQLLVLVIRLLFVFLF